MTRTNVFLSNKTQAVRLPKDVAFPEHVHEVDITVVGDARLVAPAGQTWKHWFTHGTRVSDDFLVDRDQPPMQQRVAI